MASSYYPGFRAPASARVRLDRGGAVTLECGNQEIGTGACTVMAQAVAERLGVPAESVQIRSGDSRLPETPMAAGAMSTASVIPAVEAAANALRQRIIALAIADAQSPLFNRAADQITWESPSLLSVAEGIGDDPTAVLARAGLTSIDAGGQSGPMPPTHSVNTFGACFAEVRVDPDLGEVRVSRLVGAYAAGRIMNARLARSQLIGGLIFGIGMALHEKAVVDPRSGLIVNRSFTDYLLPVHADVPDIDIHLIEEADPYVPSGVKGLGMNGTVGAAAAIANAVHHATGFRIRDLPIDPRALVGARSRHA
jgi:xanthine dehydrogenase YagR molybdenum-binding subunit